MIDASLCKAKDGSFNKPLCLAWSSMGRNHYIALVGVKGRQINHCEFHYDIYHTNISNTMKICSGCRFLMEYKACNYIVVNFT